MGKKLLAAVLITLVLMGLSAGEVVAERPRYGMTYGIEALDLIPVRQDETDMDGSRAVFNMYAPWLQVAVNCDGVVDHTSEWWDAARYDISDTSGQSDGIPDPLGTVDLYVKQDSFGVWFAVIDHADSLLGVPDQIGLYLDDDDDGCFPASLTNEGNIWLLQYPAGPVLRWRWLQDFDCDAGACDCLADDQGSPEPCTLSHYAIGMTSGRVSYEIYVPYGALDHELQVTSPEEMTVGLYIYCLDWIDDLTQHYHGEWPSQNRLTTWAEPCFWGDLICEGPRAWYYKPDYPDYAPSGMPDFDQKQHQWSNPPGSGIWTWCGPVAVANCLWWFDSEYQWLINSASPPPPQISDDFDLVIRYYEDHDDHGTANVQPLVEDLAWHMDTDGQRTGGASKGTSVCELGAAVSEWLLNTDTDTLFYVHVERAPDFFWIAEEIARCQDVILLLGFWQYYDLGWKRVGGHWVTCAGVDSVNLTLALSDPFDDLAELGGPGRIRDGVLISHPHGLHSSDVHNDAGNVSHDYYTVLYDSLTPGWPWSFPNYPYFDDVVFSGSFANCPLDYEGYQGPYMDEMPLDTEIEYAVAISPVPQNWHYKGGYPDYAPSGMPDFDQNQHGWTARCGPTAVANCLWWFDSKYQWLTTGGNPSPPYIQDDFYLVISYFGEHDDHAWQSESGWDNVQYLIGDMAYLMDTDPVAGTSPGDVQAGIELWLADREVDDILYVHTLIDSTRDPDFFATIEEEIECCQDVILLLGFWEQVGPSEWHRIGGHYVTCAGVCSDSMKIMISDPDYDQQVTEDPPDPKWHNNAALVCHDIYRLASSSSPGGYWGLSDYPAMEVGPRHQLENCPDHLLPYQYEWASGSLVTEIEAAIMVSPFVKPAAVESLRIYPDGGPTDVTDIRLAWSPVTKDTAGCPEYPIYVVYRDTVPDFTVEPTKELTTTAATEYEDIDAAGDAALNYYYYVNARAGTLESANSECVGEFDRDLVNPSKREAREIHGMMER